MIRAFSTRSAGMPLAALLALVVLWPGGVGAGLSGEQRGVLAVAVVAMVFWVLEVLPIAATGLLVGPALALFTLRTPKEALSAYASPLLFVFIGAFMLTKAATEHDLDGRIARAIAAHPKLRVRPLWMLGAFIGAAWLLSMWISNTATTAAFLPLLRRLERRENPSPWPPILLAYSTSIGGMATPVGSPPNLIMLAYLRKEGVDIDFFGWMARALPISLALLAIALVIMLPRCADWMPERKAEAPVESDTGPLTPPQRVVVACFALALVGWLTPSVARVLDVSAADTLARALHPGVVVIVATLPLFLLRRAGLEQRLLPWTEAERIEWGIVLLFGGGIALGEAMFATGLAERLALAGLAPFEASPWLAVGVILLTTLLLTEVCSNTASAAMLGPIALPAAMAIGIDPVSLGIGVGLSASCAFMLPMATGPNALVLSVPSVTFRRLASAGVFINAIAWVCIAGWTLWLSR